MAISGEPMKMATVTIDSSLPPGPYLDQLSGNLVDLLPRLDVSSIHHAYYFCHSFPT